MKPNQELLDNLCRQHLLPSSPLAVNNFAELETAIVHHVASRDETPPNVVWNDAERIQRAASYEFITDEFFAAMPQPPEYEVVCHENADTQRHECQLTVAGKRTTTSWDQEGSDWVEEHFFSFIRKATASAAGRFVEIGTSDQSYMFVYVDAGTAQAFEDYADEDASSRESFFTGQSESAKYRFADIKILPREEFRRALDTFKRCCMDGDDPADIASYAPGKALLLNPSSKYDGALRLFLRAHRNNVGSTRVRTAGALGS